MENVRKNKGKGWMTILAIVLLVIATPIYFMGQILATDMQGVESYFFILGSMTFGYALSLAIGVIIWKVSKEKVSLLLGFSVIVSLFALGTFLMGLVSLGMQLAESRKEIPSFKSIELKEASIDIPSNWTVKENLEEETIEIHSRDYSSGFSISRGGEGIADIEILCQAVYEDLKGKSAYENMTEFVAGNKREYEYRDIEYDLLTDGLDAEATMRIVVYGDRFYVLSWWILSDKKTERNIEVLRRIEESLKFID